MRLLPQIRYSVALMACALPLTGGVASASAAHAAPSLEKPKYAANVKSSRGYTFGLYVYLHRAPTFELKPGYNVGDTDLLGADPSWMQLVVSNTTPGRQLDVLVPSIRLFVTAAWKIPGGYVSDGMGYQYFRAGPVFGSQNSYALPPNASGSLPRWPQSVSSWSPNTSKADIAKITRAVRSAPTYVMVWSEATSGGTLDGYWDACPSFGAIAAWTRNGRAMALKPSLCQIIHNGSAG